MSTINGGHYCIISFAVRAGTPDGYLSKPQLKELVLYSPQHVARLEKAGLFPKRVQLGPNRVGWVEDEVLDWLRTRMEGREEA